MNAILRDAGLDAQTYGHYHPQLSLPQFQDTESKEKVIQNVLKNKD